MYFRWKVPQLKLDGKISTLSQTTLHPKKLATSNSSSSQSMEEMAQMPTEDFKQTQTLKTSRTMAKGSIKTLGVLLIVTVPQPPTTKKSRRLESPCSTEWKLLASLLSCELPYPPSDKPSPDSSTNHPPLHINRRRKLLPNTNRIKHRSS